MHPEPTTELVRTTVFSDGSTDTDIAYLEGDGPYALCTALRSEDPFQGPYEQQRCMPAEYVVTVLAWDGYPADPCECGGCAA